jgi:hypothetical protein
MTRLVRRDPKTDQALAGLFLIEPAADGHSTTTVHVELPLRFVADRSSWGTR